MAKKITKADLIKFLQSGIFLFETDQSVGKGAGAYASKVIDWDKYWETAKKLVTNI